MFFEVAEVVVKVPVEEGRFHHGSYGAAERSDEERRRIPNLFGLLGSGTKKKKCAEGREKRTVHEQLHHQQRHQTALGIVHVIPEPQPLVCFAANLAFLAVLVALGHEMVSIEMVTEIFGNKARFCQDQRLVGVGALHTNNGGFAQRMDFLEFLGSQHVRATLKGLQVILDVELLEEPENTLRAGLLEPTTA